MSLKTKIDRLEKSLSADRKLTWMEFISPDFPPKNPGLYELWIEGLEEYKPQSILNVEISPELREKIVEFIYSVESEEEDNEEEVPEPPSKQKELSERLKGAIVNEGQL